MKDALPPNMHHGWPAKPVARVIACAERADGSTLVPQALLRTWVQAPVAERYSQVSHRDVDDASRPPKRTAPAGVLGDIAIADHVRAVGNVP